MLGVVPAAAIAACRVFHSTASFTCPFTSDVVPAVPDTSSAAPSTVAVLTGGVAYAQPHNAQRHNVVIAALIAAHIPLHLQGGNQGAVHDSGHVCSCSTYQPLAPSCYMLLLGPA
jgi:hypothetical protein